MRIVHLRLALCMSTLLCSTSCVSGATQSEHFAFGSEVAWHASWIDPAAKGEALVYVTNRSTGDINILSFPQGVPVGAISGFVEPEGQCVDSAGNVFITDAKTERISVFAHGGVVPIRTLEYPHSQPYDCSVDPTTGDLAVASRLFSRKPHSVVAVFAAAKGTPKTYAHPAFETQFCGYDKSGNLYLDGSDHRSDVAELPKGGDAIINATLDQPIMRQGTIQWDGAYIDFSSTNPPTAYRVVFHGRRGKIVSSTKLLGTNGVSRLWIQGGKILGSDSDVYVWNYPAGGEPIAHYSGFTVPVDAVVTEPHS